MELFDQPQNNQCVTIIVFRSLTLFHEHFTTKCQPPAPRTWVADRAAVARLYPDGPAAATGIVPGTPYAIPGLSPYELCMVSPELVMVSPELVCMETSGSGAGMSSGPLHLSGHRRAICPAPLRLGSECFVEGTGAVARVSCDRPTGVGTR